MIININPVGRDYRLETRNALDAIVQEHFDQLLLGARKMLDKGVSGVEIREADYWAPVRIQINNTRLHKSQGLKIASGHHKYNDSSVGPSPAQLTKTVMDLQTLFDWSARTVGNEMTITIKKGE